MRYFVLLISLLVLVASPTYATNKRVIKLASLEWPPYTGAKLPNQGATSAVIKAAARAAGYTVEITFLPWERAVAETTAGKYDGYFPEYLSADLIKTFSISAAVGNGPLGLAEREDDPIEWSEVKDLSDYTIGVVNGYINTTEFDALVAKKVIRVESVVSDDTNVKKLVARRMPAAVIDRNVLNYLLTHDPALSKHKDAIQFNEQLLEDKKLYVAFARTARGLHAKRNLARGLSQIDVNKIQAANMK